MNMTYIIITSAYKGTNWYRWLWRMRYFNKYKQVLCFPQKIKNIHKICKA